MKATEKGVFVFVYEKYGQIKVLGLEDSKMQHNELISRGWNHTNTIDPCVFIQYLHNDAEDVDITEEIKSLSKTPKTNNSN